MASFVCNDDTFTGRSVERHPELMGGIVQDAIAAFNKLKTDYKARTGFTWIKDGWPEFGKFRGDGTRDIPGYGTKATTRVEFTSNYKITMNSAIANITGRNYPAITKSITSLDVTWTSILNNHRGVLPAFDQNYWRPRIAGAWAKSGVVYLKWMTDLLNQYQQGLNFQNAVALDNVAAVLSSELPKVTAASLVFPVTRKQPGYGQAVDLWRAKIAELNALAEAARAKGYFTEEQVLTEQSITTGQQVADIRTQEATSIALARGDFAPVKQGFNFLPLVIGAAAIGGGYLLLKG